MDRDTDPHLPGATPEEWQQSHGPGMITGAAVKTLAGADHSTIRAFVESWVEGNVVLGSPVWALGQALRADADRAGIAYEKLEEALGNVERFLANHPRRRGGPEIGPGDR